MKMPGGEKITPKSGSVSEESEASARSRSRLSTGELPSTSGENQEKHKESSISSEGGEMVRRDPLFSNLLN